MFDGYIEIDKDSFPSFPSIQEGGLLPHPSSLDGVVDIFGPGSNSVKEERSFNLFWQFIYKRVFSSLYDSPYTKMSPFSLMEIACVFRGRCYR